MNTLLLSSVEFVGCKYWRISFESEVLGGGTLLRYPFADLNFDSDLRIKGISSEAPLMVAARSDDQLQFFAQIRTGSDDILNLWCGSAEDPVADDANIVDYFCFILRTGRGLMEANRAFLNSHQCYFRKFWPELEIEHKLTISSQIDIYGLAVHFRNLIGHDRFKNYIWEYRDDFQQWDFVNFVYEIQAPEDEAGYVAFIPDSLGKVVVKRKWFASDSVHRRETKWLGVVVDGDYGSYIAQRFGVNGSLVGGFRRTRFDITLEALATGNVHSIMIDRCRFMNDAYQDLSQIEIEYLHSRSLRPSASDAVEGELDEIVALTESVLRELDIDYVNSPMSKLTYMKKMAELGERR